MAFSNKMRIDILTLLEVAIALFPLYRDCVTVGGHLLAHWLSGQLADAMRRLGSSDSISVSSWKKRQSHRESSWLF